MTSTAAISENGKRNRGDDTSFLSRAASYNNLRELPASEPGSPGLRRTFSDITSPDGSQSPSKEGVSTGKDILRRTSMRSKTKATVTVSRFTLSEEDLTAAAGNRTDGARRETSDGDAQGYPAVLTKAPEPVARPLKARSMSGRLARLARKSWVPSSSSRSPSPTPKSPRRRLGRREGQSPTKSAAQNVQDPASFAATADSPSHQTSRKRTVLNKRPRRPRLAVVTQNDTPSAPNSPSKYSLRARNSFEKITASFSVNVTTPILPPMPKGAAATVASFTANADRPRKKDELWSVFRGLEADYQKFQSKSSALKANVIRTSLLPFFGRRCSLSSCSSLRPEDLDRRVNILNKWWTGLLEMLNGKNNQSISGIDRPVFLEAVVGIMSRPEWRIPFPSPLSKGCGSNAPDLSSSSASEISEASSGSDFLVESIHHNIRNIFTQNLLSQMAFVVERMSMRHAPASLVAFCGKACAYAFAFCPGVAEMLVRLWNTSPDHFRRVLADADLRRCKNPRIFLQEFACNFPGALQPLAFHTHAALARYLRQKPNVPLSVTQIPWHGPWVARWCGRDTDLFFIFVKYIHVLLADFLPPGTTKSQRAFAPGLVPIHAQLLVVLEDTLHKQSNAQVAENSHAASTITFDDLIEGADATASALPLGAANSHRPMAENRLVMLLRDFLSESSTEPSLARIFYAESFCSIMKAAARKTSMYDHSACFLLCDFIEEVMPILARFSQAIDTEVFDWKFWLSVCRAMMLSQNSLTEIRVFSFLFCTWKIWVATEERKSAICLGMILQRPVFHHYFNHWSPMIRAYFHRLLCWRVARFNGDPSPLDTTIYERLAERLRSVWEYYVAFQCHSEKAATAPLSSAPCTPAPGRRIVIIRCDNQLATPTLFVSFDRVVLPVSTERPPVYRDQGVLTMDAHESDSQPAAKKRWGIFRSMFGGSSSSTRSDERSLPGGNSNESDATTVDPPTDAAASESNPDDPFRSKSAAPPELWSPKLPHQPFSFKFSLEWSDRLQWPSKNKRLYTPCLPLAAQLHLQLRRSTENPPADDDGSCSPDELTPNLQTTPASDLSATSHHDAPPSAQSHISAAAICELPTQPLQEDHAEPVQLDPSDPSDPTASPKPLSSFDSLVASKYAGRALAEWAQIVTECDSFFSRRRDEGVPCDKLVETPTLGVESFRK